MSATWRNSTAGQPQRAKTTRLVRGLSDPVPVEIPCCRFFGAMKNHGTMQSTRPRARRAPRVQVLDVELRYTARRAGPIDEVYACRVFGMALPLGFAISGKNRGPTLSFGLVGDDERVPRPLQRPQVPQYVGEVPLPEPDPAPPLEVRTRLTCS